MQLPMMALGLLYAGHLQSLVHKDKFVNFVQELNNRYSRDIAYHNDLHASDTA